MAAADLERDAESNLVSEADLDTDDDDDDKDSSAADFLGMRIAGGLTATGNCGTPGAEVEGEELLVVEEEEEEEEEIKSILG